MISNEQKRKLLTFLFSIIFMFLGTHTSCCKLQDIDDDPKEEKESWGSASVNVPPTLLSKDA
jgi:hypothetical protein